MRVRQKLMKALDFVFVDHVVVSSLVIICGIALHYLSLILFWVVLGLALAVWFARRPIARWFDRRFENAANEFARAVYGVRECSMCGETLPNGCYYAVVKWREKPYCKDCLEKLGTKAKKVRVFKPTK